MQNFLNLPAGPSTQPAGRPGGDARPGAGAAAGAIAGAAGAGAVSDFFEKGPSAGTGAIGAGGDRPGAGERPGAGDRAGAGERAGTENRQARRENVAQNRPERVENRQQLQDNRQQRHNEIRDQVADNYPRLDFWSDHPNWAAWRVNHPYRWATWGALTGWFNYGWSEPMYYNYGENVYYADDQVMYGETAAASTEEYAQQAEAIVTAAPETKPEQAEWMPLGVFAITQDGQATGAPPTLFLQLVVSKDGMIGGTFENKATDTSQPIEGMVDKKTQRAAWVASGKKRPIMETGIFNLTKDTAPALVHFEDGTTQQRLLVRMDEPKQ